MVEVRKDKLKIRIIIGIIAVILALVILGIASGFLPYLFLRTKVFDEGNYKINSSVYTNEVVCDSTGGEIKKSDFLMTVSPLNVVANETVVTITIKSKYTFNGGRLYLRKPITQKSLTEMSVTINDISCQFKSESEIKDWQVTYTYSVAGEVSGQIKIKNIIVNEYIKK